MFGYVWLYGRINYFLLQLMRLKPKAASRDLEHRVYHKLIIALRYQWYCLLPSNFDAFWKATLRHQEHVDYTAIPFTLPPGIAVDPSLIAAMNSVVQAPTVRGTLEEFAFVFIPNWSQRDRTHSVHSV